MPENIYYIYNASKEKVEGPYGLEQLVELAASHVITPETMVASVGSQHWSKICNLPNLFKHLFPDLEEIFSETESDPVEYSQIEELLKINREHEDALTEEEDSVIPALDPTKPPPPLISRRARDYIFIMLLVNSTIGILAYYFPPNPFVVVCLGSLFIVLNAGVSWMFWMVIDKY